MVDVVNNEHLNIHPCRSARSGEKVNANGQTARHTTNQRSRWKWRV